MKDLDMPFIIKPPRTAGDSVAPAALTIDPPPRSRSKPADPPADAERVASDSQKDENYVGYKHPPKRTQFQKGVSGNPKGRPKGAKGLKAIIREVLTEKVSVRTPDGTKRISKMEALVHRKAELGFGGNLRAIQACGTLYQAAVPEEGMQAAGAGPQNRSSPEELSAVDGAILAELKAMLLAERGEEL